MPDYIAIEPNHLERIRTVMRRLYSEDRMNGDQMRDAAQQLQVVIDRAIPFDSADLRPNTQTGA